MRRLLLLLFAAILLTVSALIVVLSDTEAQTVVTTIIVEDNVILDDAKRLGVNLGKHDQFASSQLLKNVITNPGFEAGEFATILFADETSGDAVFRQDNWEVAWNSERVGQPEGFWEDASYEVLLGNAQGQTGVVDAFRHDENRPTFDVIADGRETAFGDEDLIVVRKSIEGYEGDLHGRGSGVADTSTTRPDSPGTQSLKLTPLETGGAAFRYFMDSFGRDGDQTAGKLFIIEGNWRFEVWARGSSNSDSMAISFEREGERTFFSDGFPLTTAWQKYVIEFYVPPGTDVQSAIAGPVPLLALNIAIPNSTDAIWIDDMSLSRRDYSNPTAFTDKVTSALQELQPGILRKWSQNALGNTLENQLAEPFARKTTGFSPRSVRPAQYDYSLHEFLELAAYVDAEPWYVIPPTFTDAELDGLMAYLSAPAGSNEWANKRAALGQEVPWTEVFPTIHLEFGNELWGGNSGNDPFIGATFRGGVRVGEIANERFTTIKRSAYYDSAEFNLIIGGQFEFPGRQAQIEAGSRQHDSLALSPYFGILEAYDSDEDIYYPLYARPLQDVMFGNLSQALDHIRAEGNGTELNIYEINFHTTEGDAPIDLRNEFMTGVNSALALPLYMLTYQDMLGVQNQAAYVLSQYSFRMGNGQYARIWGLLRDFEAGGRQRPSFLGLKMANMAIRGDMLNTRHVGADPAWSQPPINAIDAPIQMPFVRSFAYREGGQYASVLMNLHLSDPQTIIIQSPNTPDPAALLHTVTSGDIKDNNEQAQTVTIETTQLADFSQSYELILPPSSMHVLEWGDAGSAPLFEIVTPTATPAPLPTSTPDPSIPQYIPTIRIIQNTPDGQAVANVDAFPTSRAETSTIGENALDVTPIPDKGVGADQADGPAAIVLILFGLLGVLLIGGGVVFALQRSRPSDGNKF